MVASALLAMPGCGDNDGGSGGGGSAATTTTTTSSSGQGGSGQGGGAEAATCEGYCDTIMANCTADNAQYDSKETCLAVCALLTPGTPGEKMGNTLECHAYHANAAAMDGARHCPHAGPAGGEVCGDASANFCALALEACPEVFQDDAACSAAVANFDATTPYSTAETTGNTLACRLYHLTAATIDTALHCPHIAGDGGPCQ
jgi:hypothetical protein